MTQYTSLPLDDSNLDVVLTESADLVTIDITPAAVNVTSAVTSINGLTGTVVLTTTNINEGTNLYYTDARADANFATNFLNETTDNLTQGLTNLYYDDTLVDSHLADGTITDIKTSQLTLTGGIGTQGQVTWNADEETLDVIQNGATLQLGQETQIHVRNTTLASIPDGTPVMATGTIGNSGRITIAPMDGTDPNNAKFFLGVTTETIGPGEDGKTTAFGKVRGVNTTAFLDGDVLWISPTTPGAFTKTEPTAPDISMAVAFVIHSHASGTLMVRAMTGVDEHKFAHRVHTHVMADITDSNWASTAYVDQAEIDAVAASTAYTDGRETAITTAYQAYADTAEADAITSANAYTDTGLATKQALDAGLTSIATLGTVADKLLYTTGVDTYAETDLTAFSRTILAQPTKQAWRDALDILTLTSIVPIANGATVSPSTIAVTSDGVNVTLSMEKAGGGDIQVFFSGTDYTIDTTPAATVTLTAGTDTAPVLNYVYIPESTKVLTVGTDWPEAGAYAPVATVLVPSAAYVQTDSVYKLHFWTDHLADAENSGHLAHINYWIRNQPATWHKGIALTPTVVPGPNPDDIWISTTSGEVLQLHETDFPAFNTQTGSHMHVINHPTTPYLEITNMNVLTVDSNNVAISNNKWATFVIWGVQSSTANDCQLMVNLPTAWHSSEADALADGERYTVYDIPQSFLGTGFLIARLTFKYTTAASGTWELVENRDLRGQFPTTLAGGGSGAGVSSLGALTDVDLTQLALADGHFLQYVGANNAWQNVVPNVSTLTNDAGYIANLLEDTTPQLGGNLDLNGFTVGNGVATYLSENGNQLAIQGGAFGNWLTLDGSSSPFPGNAKIGVAQTPGNSCDLYIQTGANGRLLTIAADDDATDTNIHNTLLDVHGNAKATIRARNNANSGNTAFVFDATSYTFDNGTITANNGLTVNNTVTTFNTDVTLDGNAGTRALSITNGGKLRLYSSLWQHSDTDSNYQQRTTGTSLDNGTTAQSVGANIFGRIPYADNTVTDVEVKQDWNINYNDAGQRELGVWGFNNNYTGADNTTNFFLKVKNQGTSTMEQVMTADENSIDMFKPTKLYNVDLSTYSGATEDGMMVLNTNAAFGAGVGVYAYYSAAWNKL